MRVRTCLTSGFVAAALTGALALPVQAEAAAPAPTKFTIGTHNTKHGTSHFSGLADVIGWQELDNSHGDSATRMQNALGHRYASYVPRGAAQEDTISWRRSEFVRVGQGVDETHHGYPKVTPDRYVVWVVLKVRATGKKFAFVNTHFVSAAFAHHAVTQRKLRQRLWYKHYHAMQNDIAALRTKKLPVLAVGDFNREKVLHFAGLTHYSTAKVSGTPLDQLYATTPNLVGKATRLAKNGSDHFAYRATVKLGR